MIPKIIHYCWFGNNKKSKEVRKYINTWKKFNPDYKIIEWNEENFDIRINKFVREAYERKKFAFVSDYVRLYALYNYGGVYMDVDVECIKKFDFNKDDNLITSFELEKIVMTGVIIASKNQRIIQELLESYNTMSFSDVYVNNQLVPNTVLFTEMLTKYGLKLVNMTQRLGEGITIYSRDYYCALDNENSCLDITRNTVTIHHYSGSWMPLNKKISNRIKKVISKVLGQKKYKQLKNINKKLRRKI